MTGTNDRKHAAEHRSMHDLRSVVLILIIKQILNATLFGLSEFGIRLLFGLRNTGDGASATTFYVEVTIRLYVIFPGISPAL